jgi:hypothetical protein
MSDTKPTAGFSANELHVLTSVLNEIIPPSADGRLPGAGQLDLARFIDLALQKTPDLRAMIAQGLSDLDAQARERKETDFATLGKEDKVQLLNEQGFVLPLAFQTYIAYYQQPRVAAALGLEARPPHPTGYQLPPNDLTLVEPVRRRAKRYREC